MTGAIEHRAAMNFVRAGSRDHVEEEATSRRHRRPGAAHLIIRFLERVWVEIHDGLRAVAIQIRNVHAFDQESVLVGAAVHGGAAE